jgi:plastocyanin
MTVQMVLEGSTYKFSPDNLTIKSGDVVTFHNVTGGPHNVSSGPTASRRAPPTSSRPACPTRWPRSRARSSPRPNGTYKVTFTGAPAGDYKFYCLPHLALGMHGKITVQ